MTGSSSLSTAQSSFSIKPPGTPHQDTDIQHEQSLLEKIHLKIKVIPADTYGTLVRGVDREGEGFAIPSPSDAMGFKLRCREVILSVTGRPDRSP
jgi:hypothetical protein